MSDFELDIKKRYMKWLAKQIELAIPNTTSGPDENLVKIFKSYVKLYDTVDRELEMWVDECNFFAQGHAICAEKLGSIYTKLRVILCSVSPIGGLGVMFPQYVDWFLLSGICVSAFAVSLTFLKYSERSKTHKDAMSEYKFLAKDIGIMLKDEDRTKDVTKVLSKQLSLRMRELEKTSDMIPINILQKIRNSKKKS